MKYPKLAYYYSHAALLLMNSFIAIVALNVLLYAAFLLKARPVHQNVVEQKYGSKLLRVYPELDATSINQLLSETWSRPFIYEPYVQFKEAPFKGKFVNVSEAGFRVSENQGPWPPPSDAVIVFVFGGSTTFGYGLPDNETLASYLQDSLGRRIPRQVYIYNFAGGSYQSSQERILFQELLVRGLRPNMAIFIDGLNDFAFRHVPAYTEVLQRLFKPDHSPSWRDGVPLLVQDWPMARLARGIRDRMRRTPLQPPQHVDSNIDEVADSVARRYFANKREIEAIARDYAVQVVFVWQPIPFYKYDQRYHLFSREAGVNRYASAGYERVRQIVEAEDEGPDFLWCADIQERITEPLYVDYIHFTAAMSRRLAEYIGGLLTQRKLLPSEAATRSKRE